MDQTLLTLDRMRTFVRVAERGNLSAVAREFNIGQSTVTRHLRDLEEGLGVALLSRTTRRVTLTEEGARFLDTSLRMLRILEQGAEEARGSRDAPSGTIRISCTAALGVRHVTRLVFAFQNRYPEIQVDLSLTDDRIDLVRDGIDLALRLGPLSDSSMKRRVLGYSRRLLVASPAYLTAWGQPLTPSDLAGHQGIRMVNVGGSDHLILRGRDGKDQRVPFGGRLRLDHGLAAREAFAAGQGLGPTHRWLVDDLLQSGALLEVLPDYTLPPVPLSMLIVPQRAAITRIRLLVDYLVRESSSIPGLHHSPAW
ncbi:LysR family transcriptional regulator [Rhodospirillum sp. A1_3_36]|uniref:LysR family transcriptional regulator n=1 Tax=Rhodospirillum sp. A1_3_36 TaxID=3391666 RepID=UPI0039A588F0